MKEYLPSESNAKQLNIAEFFEQSKKIKVFPNECDYDKIPCYKIEHEDYKGFWGKLYLYDGDKKFDFIGTIDNSGTKQHFSVFERQFPNDMYYLPLFIEHNLAARTYFDFIKLQEEKSGHKYTISQSFEFSISSYSSYYQTSIENATITNTIIKHINELLNSKEFINVIDEAVRDCFVYNKKGKCFSDFLFDKILDKLQHEKIRREDIGFVLEDETMFFNVKSTSFFNNFRAMLYQPLINVLKAIDDIIEFIKSRKDDVFIEIKFLNNLSWIGLDHLIDKKLESIMIDSSALNYEFDHYEKRLYFNGENYFAFSKVLSILLDNFALSLKVLSLMYKEHVLFCRPMIGANHISFFMPFLNPRIKSLDGINSVIDYVQIRVQAL